MGCPLGKPDEIEKTEASHKIDKELKLEAKQRYRIVKLLLLGTGESGKSTIVKQMKLIVNNGHSQAERLGFRSLIFSNTIQSLIVIIRSMSKLDINFTDHERYNDAQTLLQLAGTVESNGPLNEELFRAMFNLWQDPGIQQCFQRSAEYQLIDSAEYYLNSLERLSNSNYIPTEQDILRTRVKTAGIIETTVEFKELIMKIVDVGGQRAERKKWIHCFDNVDAIIFIVALNEYDLRLREDPEVNRMMESLRLFDSMCNNVVFKDTCMILFLNKRDLFEVKIKRFPLSICFEEYTDENTYEKAVMYIKFKFESLNKYRQTKLIFTHITCATDTDNVKNVFEDIKAIMIQRLLELHGLM